MCQYLYVAITSTANQILPLFYSSHSNLPVMEPKSTVELSDESADEDNSSPQTPGAAAAPVSSTPHVSVLHTPAAKSAKRPQQQKNENVQLVPLIDKIVDQLGKSADDIGDEYTLFGRRYMLAYTFENFVEVFLKYHLLVSLQYSRRTSKATERAMHKIQEQLYLVSCSVPPAPLAQ